MSLDSLPNEVLQHIQGLMSVKDLARFARVDKRTAENARSVRPRRIADYNLARDREDYYRMRDLDLQREANRIPVDQLNFDVYNRRRARNMIQANYYAQIADEIKGNGKKRLPKKKRATKKKTTTKKPARPKRKTTKK